MAGSAAAAGVTARLLLDEHYSAEIARRLRADGHDVLGVTESVELREQPDTELFRYAASEGRRIVTENIKDFRPLLVHAYSAGEPIAQLLLVSPRRFPRGSGARTHDIAAALAAWLCRPDADQRPDEDGLT